MKLNGIEQVFWAGSSGEGTRTDREARFISVKLITGFLDENTGTAWAFKNPEQQDGPVLCPTEHGVVTKGCWEQGCKCKGHAHHWNGCTYRSVRKVQLAAYVRKVPSVTQRDHTYSIGVCDLPDGHWLLASLGWFRNDPVVLQGFASTDLSSHMLLRIYATPALATSACFF